eukprot:7124553-Ditylum_brightwellii.AAC.1
MSLTTRTTLVEMILRRVLSKTTTVMNKKATMMTVQVAIAKKRSLLVQVGRKDKTRTRTTCPEVLVQGCCLLWKATTIATPSKTGREKRHYFYFEWDLDKPVHSVMLLCPGPTSRLPHPSPTY